MQSPRWHRSRGCSWPVGGGTARRTRLTYREARRVIAESAAGASRAGDGGGLFGSSTAATRTTCCA